MTAEESVAFYEQQQEYRYQRRMFNEKLAHYFETHITKQHEEQTESKAG